MALNPNFNQIGEAFTKQVWSWALFYTITRVMIFYELLTMIQHDYQ